MVNRIKKDPKINKLTKWVTVRMTEPEFTKITELSEATGLSKSDIFRLPVFDSVVRAEWVDKLDQYKIKKSDEIKNADTEKVNDLITAVNRIGTNVNQIAHQANKNKNVPHSTLKVLNETNKKLDTILEALGCRTWV